MAYIAANLSCFGTVNGFTLWVYDTTDTHASLDTAAYFTGDALNMLKVGDLVLVRVFTTAAKVAISTMGFHIVKDVVVGTSIDVSDVTVLVMTDTD